jgi:SOS-response transcriptional repressor LexA
MRPLSAPLMLLVNSAADIGASRAADDAVAMKSAASSKKANVTAEDRADSARLKALWEATHPRPTQEALAQQMGKGQSTVANMLNGHMAITLSAARVFAKVIGCDIAEFSLRLGAEAAKTAEVVRTEGDFAEIKMTDVKVSAGHGSIPHLEEELGTLKFRRDFLRSVGANETSAVIVTVRGHSMDPTIKDGATLLVNRSNRLPQRDKLYVFWRRDEGLVVKRLVKEGGVWLARSDNDDRKTYPDFPFQDDEHLIGRAVWMGARL